MINLTPAELHAAYTQRIVNRQREINYIKASKSPTPRDAEVLAILERGIVMDTTDFFQYDNDLLWIIMNEVAKCCKRIFT